MGCVLSLRDVLANEMLVRNVREAVRWMVGWLDGWMVGSRARERAVRVGEGDDANTKTKAHSVRGRLRNDPR